MSKDEVKEGFKLLFITAHGFASLLANNSMQYDENYCIEILEKNFYKINK